MFGLEQRHIDLILEILNKNFNSNTDFYIFGSRSRGDYKEYSDIDIAVDMFGEKISADTLGSVLIEFEDSLLPYEVDIVDLNSIDDNFKNLIKNSLVKFV